MEDKAKIDYPLHWMIWWNNVGGLKEALENKSVRSISVSLIEILSLTLLRFFPIEV